MRPTFAGQPRPFIVNVIQAQTPAEAISTMRNGEADGATCHDLHLNILKPEYQTPETLKSIMDATLCPVLALYYRRTNSPSDEERVEKQLMALEAGAAGADIPADTFDLTSKESLVGLEDKYPFAAAAPAEISMRPEIIEKQKALIEKIHGMGAEVLMSAHTGAALSCEQAIALAQEIESRGPDLVKIVTPCPDEDHLGEMIKTVVKLDRVMKKPFQYQAMGRLGRITRIVGPMLGCALVFCNQRFTEICTPEQPLISYMNKVLGDGWSYYRQK